MKTLLLWLTVAMCSCLAQAQVPHKIAYQGYVTTAGGTPINATVAMVFRLYTAAAGGTALYSEAQPVTVSNGVFSAVIGAVIPLDPVAFDVPYFLGVTIGTDPEMAPRQPVVAAPYALRAASNTANDALYFMQGGNAFAAAAVIGTTDDQALDVRVNGARVMRYEPNAISPNVIGGSPANTITAGVRGATIGGGGVPSGNTDPTFGAEAPNRVTDAYGTVGGGYGNRAGDDAGLVTNVPFATVGGGGINIASGESSTIGGGRNGIASGMASTVAGGGSNQAIGSNSTVAGGLVNIASGLSSTVAGGYLNTASGAHSTLAGGSNNIASGAHSTVAGGENNTAGGDFSFAAGQHAKVRTAAEVGGGDLNGDAGTFVWADNSSTSDFISTGENQFLVRATGGVAINTNTPVLGSALTISDAAPTMTLKGSAANATESGRLWLIESGVPASCSGGFLHYNGSTNLFDIGVQSSTACDVANDLNVFQISRNTGFVGVLTAPSATNPLTVGSTTSNGNGASVSPTGVWTNASSRTFKEAFTAVDARAVLAKLVALPIATWSYQGDAQTRHMGPVAEDFMTAFGLGSNERYIGTVDADGVALVAIQGLHQVVQHQDSELAALHQRVAQGDSLRGALAAEMNGQTARIDALEAQAADLALLREQLARLQAAALIHAAGRHGLPGTQETVGLVAVR